MAPTSPILWPSIGARQFIKLFDKYNTHTHVRQNEIAVLHEGSLVYSNNFHLIFFNFNPLVSWQLYVTKGIRINSSCLVAEWAPIQISTQAISVFVL